MPFTKGKRKKKLEILADASAKVLTSPQLQKFHKLYFHILLFQKILSIYYILRQINLYFFFGGGASADASAMNDSFTCSLTHVLPTYVKTRKFYRMYFLSGFVLSCSLRNKNPNQSCFSATRSKTA